MALPVIFGALTSAQLSQLDQNFAALGALTPIPCTRDVTSTANSIVFDPISNTPTVSQYNQFQSYICPIGLANTGSITIKVGSLPALNGYLDTGAGPAPLSGGELQPNNMLVGVYDSALNSGAGGFHLSLIGGSVASSVTTRLTNLETIVPIPCTHGGTANAITLTVIPSTPAITAYNQYQMFIFTVGSVNTGSVTVRVAALATLNGYKDTGSGPVLLTGNELQPGNVVLSIYDSALNSGAGGFHLSVVGSGGGGGTVTSVGLSMPADFNVSNTPVTGNATLSVGYNNQSANTIHAGPSSGAPAVPVYRALVGADLPNPSATTLGGVKSIVSTPHNFVSYIDTAGAPHQAQPATGDISGAGSAIIANVTSANLTYVSSVAPPITSGHIVIFGDAVGTVADGGVVPSAVGGITATGGIVAYTSGSGGPSSGQLPWNPAVVGPFDPKNPPANLLTVNLTTNGSNGDYLINAAGRPVLLVFPSTSARRTSISIRGASGVLCQGGALVMDPTINGGTAYYGNACIEVADSTGTVFLEGLYINPSGNPLSTAATATGGIDTATTPTTVYLTSGTSWTVPPGVTTLTSVECIGGGGGGGNGSDMTGGGGGAYSKITNLAVTPGNSVTYQIGVGGTGGNPGSQTHYDGANGGDTWFMSTTTVLAKGGAGGVYSGTGAAGGSAALGVGSTTYSGGNGGAINLTGSPTTAGCGGGGAAGSLGAGANGGSNQASAYSDQGGAGGGGSSGGTAGTNQPATSVNTGEPGGNNSNGVGSGAGGASAGANGSAGTASSTFGAGGGGGGAYSSSATAGGNGGAGGNGQEWTSTAGSGGGGGGGGSNRLGAGLAGNGGAGGNYGGGGGGGGYTNANTPGVNTPGTGGTGGGGCIVIKYGGGGANPANTCFNLGSTSTATNTQPANVSNWYLQNIHVHHIHGRGDTTNAADKSSFINGAGNSYAGNTYRWTGTMAAHNCSVYTEYQGIHANDANPTATMHVNGPFLLSNLNIEMMDDLYSTTSYGFLMADGVNITPADWNPPSYVGPNVYCNPHVAQPLLGGNPASGAGGCIWETGGALDGSGNASWTTSINNQGGMLSSAQSAVMVSAGLSASTCTIFKGHPSTGDFCYVSPASLAANLANAANGDHCGINYTSPGYVGTSTSAPGGITISLAPIANGTLLANVAGTTQFPTQTTVSALLDAAMGNNANAVLLRTSTQWVSTPANVALAGQLLSTVSNGTLTLMWRAPFPMIINSTDLGLASGACSTSITVNGVVVTGLSGLSVGTTVTNTSATGANTVTSNSSIALTVANATTTAVNLTYSVNCTRTG